jgi:hypothetical protein
MAEPTIICPECKTEIKLTESLAAPLVDSVRRDYEKRLSQKDLDIAKRETSLNERAAAIDAAKASFDEQVAAKMQQERGKIAAEEARKAKLALQTDITEKDRALVELQAVLKGRDEKLAEAQKVQADFLRKERALADKERELELTIETRIKDSLAGARDQARKEADESHRLKDAEKDLIMASMQKTIEELKRKAEQGSQQLQGEVQELELEAVLRTRFPLDRIEPVPKGEHGGDALHRVVGPLGQACGTILWESKRTKNWSDGWLPKLRDDQRAAKAEIAVIISHVLPEGIDTFELRDGVWLTHPRTSIAVAFALRHTLIETASARLSTEGQQTKMEMVYQYLTGPRFRQRVEAIVEAFSSMQEDLDKEKKAITKQWAKREEQIGRVMQSTVGMYGDLQGIAGKSLQEIKGLELGSDDPQLPMSRPEALES